MTALNLALITLGAYFIVSLFYQMLAMQVKPVQPASETVAAREQTRALGNQPITYYNTIFERDLFKTGKTAQAPATGPEIDPDSLEKTQLNLKLWGTVSGDQDQAYAVIEDTQKREQNLYRIGDTIQDAIVKMILREKVVLSVNGKDEALTMEEMDSKGGPSGRMASRGRPRPLSIPSRPPRQQRISINRSMIDEAFQDMNKLMTDIAITPHNENGELTGLNLNRIKPNSIFRRMGLRNGDVLLGVDGKPILSVEDAMSMYERLKSADNVEVQLKRRGQERTINYNIR